MKTEDGHRPRFWMVDYHADSLPTHTIIVDKQDYSLRFADETEDSVTIVLEPKPDGQRRRTTPP